jgi:hypothetical protein
MVNDKYYTAAHPFFVMHIHMMHERKVEDLEDWILQTHQPNVPSELRVFDDGLQLDYKAV